MPIAIQLHGMPLEVVVVEVVVLLCESVVAVLALLSALGGLFCGCACWSPAGLAAG